MWHILVVHSSNTDREQSVYIMEVLLSLAQTHARRPPVGVGAFDEVQDENWRIGQAVGA